MSSFLARFPSFYFHDFFFDSLFIICIWGYFFVVFPSFCKVVYFSRGFPTLCPLNNLFFVSVSVHISVSLSLPSLHWTKSRNSFFSTISFEWSTFLQFHSSLFEFLLRSNLFQPSFTVPPTNPFGLTVFPSFIQSITRPSFIRSFREIDKFLRNYTHFSSE